MNSGSTGSILVTGAVDGIPTLDITNSNGATFNSTVAVTTLDISDTENSQTVQFDGFLTANTLTTTSQGYGVSLLGGSSISTDTTFLNTGAITVGDESTDSSTFAGGLDTTAGGTENFAGTVAATDNQIDIGVASVTADATIDGGTGAINTAALTVADAATLTVGTGAVGGAYNRKRDWSQWRRSSFQRASIAQELRV